MKKLRPTNRNLIKTVGVSPGVEGKVYKIFTETEWLNFQESGQFSGSLDDIGDGFIHLSSKDQVAGVVERFFAGKRPLYVAEFSEPDLLQKLKWEDSGAAELYPHLYGFDLQAADMSGFVKL
jgi:uncharacterized protein (DUF952 family)